jgi:hypothetical protein
MALGIPYVEFLVPSGRAAGIARFYDQVMGAPSTTESKAEGTLGRVQIGRNQSLVFRETDTPLPDYDGHHIAIYVANFSRPYAFMKNRGLISEDVRNHQFRFKEIIDPENFGAAPVEIIRSGFDYVEALALTFSGGNTFLWLMARRVPERQHGS